MRGATDCAKRLKSLVNSLRNKHGRVPPVQVGDPITQLVVGILTRDMPEPKAYEALERLKSLVVDYNELRVIPAIELAEHLGDFNDARLKAEDIGRALNWIFAREHDVSLDHLLEASQRDTLAYLARVEGLEPYTIARIRLLGLKQRAFPLDEAMWAYARQMKVVNPKSPLDEAQQFIERHVPEDQLLEIFALMRKAAWTELGTAVRKRKVGRIQSAPPDRTTRNMLQAIASGQVIDADDDLPPELALDGGLEGEIAPEALVEEAEKPRTKKGAKAPKPAKLAKGGASPARAAKLRAKPSGRHAAKPTPKPAKSKRAPAKSR